MTERQKVLIRGSLETINEFSGAVVRLFYGRLFEIAPQVRPLFKTEIGEQSRRLSEMLNTIVGALDNFDTLRPVLADLGRRHVEYGVRPEHYELLRSALLWTFGNALGVQFDRETRAAWDLLIGMVSAEMLAGAAAAQSR
jgi:hemoglobin-like flavoprotein